MLSRVPFPLLISFALGLALACSDDSSPSPDGVSPLDGAVDAPNTVEDGGAETTPTPDTMPASDSTVDTVDCECRPGDGPCCDGCFYYTLTDGHVCESVEEFQCEDSLCGSDALKRVGEKLCQGFTADCTGDQTWGDWTTHEACDDGSLCVSADSSSAACSTCAHGCSSGACWAECNPLDACCNADGTLCAHGCNPSDDTCWADCDPATDACCEADGTSCDNGCDTVGSVLAAGTCWPDCDPAAGCCNANGTFLDQSSQDVRQPNANLMWYRCEYGKVWNPMTCQCTGNHQAMDWTNATTACQTLGASYRLPSEAEYRTLLGGCSTFADGWRCTSCPASTNCTAVVGPLVDSFWTATPGGGSNAYWANLEISGQSEIHNSPIGDWRRVLCVRLP